MGARLIAVRLQKSEYSLYALLFNDFEFDIHEYTKEAMNEIDQMIDLYNGAWLMTILANFMIDGVVIIRHVHIGYDFKEREEPNDILMRLITL